MIRNTNVVLAAVFSLVAVGCGPSISFTKHGNVCPPVTEDCEIELVTGQSARTYEVIGVLDIEAFSIRRIPNDDESFLAAVTPAVCRAGGDAVIPGMTGDYRYIQATVVKWIEPDAAGPACPAPEPPDETETDETEPTDDEASEDEETPADDDAPENDEVQPDEAQPDEAQPTLDETSETSRRSGDASC